MDLSGAEHVLEIGCGHGVATRLILDRLTTGRLVAVDRSNKMIDAIRKIAPDEIVSGKLVVHANPIETLPFDKQAFDRIVAVNVDFHLRLGDDWPALLRPLLRNDGLLVLAFETPPGSGKAASIDAQAKASLDAQGLAVDMTRIDGVSVFRARPLSPPFERCGRP